MPLYNSFDNGQPDARAGKSPAIVSCAEKLENPALVFRGNAYPVICYGYFGKVSRLPAVDADLRFFNRGAELEGIAQQVTENLAHQERICIQKW